MSFPILRRITHVRLQLSFNGEPSKWRMTVAWNGGSSEGVANSTEYSDWKRQRERETRTASATSSSARNELKFTCVEIKFMTSKKQASGYPLRRLSLDRANWQDSWSTRQYLCAPGSTAIQYLFNYVLHLLFVCFFTVLPKNPVPPIFMIGLWLLFFSPGSETSSWSTCTYHLLMLERPNTMNE